MLRKKIHKNAGQATVEAAFVIPIMFIVILLLIQPSIVLYDRMVMRSAAAEGCRVLATVSDSQTDLCESYVLRRLGSIPSQSLFHEHASGCSWAITLEGNETSVQTAVEITNKMKPLPLIGTGTAWLGLLDENGFLTITVRETYAVQPAWAASSALSQGVSEWIGTWNDAWTTDQR